jgi:hypothetical protein
VLHDSAQALLATRNLDDEQVKLVSRIETSASLANRLVSELVAAVRSLLNEDLPVAPRENTPNAGG